jgi:hypothetical protein
MRSFCPSGGFQHNVSGWVELVRLLAVPFAFLEIAIEHGNYPPGYEGWAWTTASVFAVGAVVIFLSRQELAGLVLDALVVSAFVCIYSFEPNSPVRELLFLPVLEAGLLYGAPVGAAWSVTSVPALGFFERQTSDSLGVPYDIGHVLGPMGLQLLVGLVTGYLACAARASHSKQSSGD